MKKLNKVITIVSFLFSNDDVSNKKNEHQNKVQYFHNIM